MNLKKRLKVIASLIDGDYLIDIGCDHALLDIHYIKEYGNYAIASDCNENAYEIAKKNIKTYGLEEKIELYKTDGLRGIPVKENATLVIAGMGTSTMISILEEAKLLPNQIILQSNNDLEILRRYIVKRGYKIEKEEVVIEKKIYNVILSCKKGKREYQNLDYELGPIIRMQEKPEYKTYINFLINAKKEILKTIPKEKKELRNKMEDKIKEYKNELK